jgi:hypothetical protein
MDHHVEALAFICAAGDRASKVGPQAVLETPPSEAAVLRNLQDT